MASHRGSSAAENELGFSRAQYVALTDGLELLYRSRTFGELMASAVQLVQPLFDADAYSVGFTDPKRQRHVAIRRPINVEYSKCSDRYRELAHQSPMLQYWLRTGDHDRVLRRSDCCDLTAYRNTENFCEIDRPNDIIQHIGTWLRPGNGRHLEVAMSRGGRTDFSIRDVTRLASLRKHIFRAYVNVCDLYLFERFVRADAADELPADAIELQDTSLAAHVDRGTDPLVRVHDLTPREREVLHWIIEGKTNQQIGTILDISWRTARLHCERIFRKLNVETRTAAAIRAIEMGFKL